jgi:hypothetical protein
MGYLPIKLYLWTYCEKEVEVTGLVGDNVRTRIGKVCRCKLPPPPHFMKIAIIRNAVSHTQQRPSILRDSVGSSKVPVLPMRKQKDQKVQETILLFHEWQN